MADQDQSPMQTLAGKDLEVIQSPENTPAIYADGAQGFAVANGVTRINLYRVVQHFDGSGKQGTIKKLIIAQLIMHPRVVRSVATWLTERCKEFEEREKQAGVQDAESSHGEQ